MEKFKVTVEITVEAENHTDAEKKVKTALVIDGFEEIRLLNTGIVWDLPRKKNPINDWNNP